MPYLCYKFIVNPPEPGSEILSVALSEENFESFVFNESGFEAYIKKINFKDEIIENLKSQFSQLSFSYSSEEIKKENWNKNWEKNFNPVVVEAFCRIRASFHESTVPPLMDILIEPKCRLVLATTKPLG